MSTSKTEKGQARPFSTRDPTCDLCRVKKIRCDRERPECINCKKANAVCSWSGHGKRPNQTAKTNRELGNIKDRVQQLEESLDNLLDIISQIRSPSGGSQDGSTEAYFDRRLSDSSSPRLDFLCFAASPPQGIEPLTVPHFIFNLYSYLQPQSTPDTSIGGVLSNSFNIDAQSLQFPMLLGEGHLDHGPVLKPPMSMMQTFLDSYFKDINPLFPIFSRETLEARIERAYAPQAGATDLADAVCFNSILMLVLLANALKSASEYAGLSLTLSNESAIETNLMETFRSNLFRAMRCSDSLMVPRIDNVQALLSLALVVQQHSYVGEAEKLLDAASKLTQSLSAEDVASAQVGPDELKGLYRCLDLIRTRCNGAMRMHNSLSYCRDPSYVSPGVVEGYLEHQHSVATSSARLCATLVEQSQAQVHDFGLIASAFSDLQLQYQAAETFHQTTLSMPQTEDELHLRNLAFSEIELHFLSARLLTRWNPARDRNVQTSIAADAIKSVKILLNMWKDVRSTSSQSVLIRCLSSPLPYAAITKIAIEASKLKQVEDLQLLAGVSQMLHSIAVFVPMTHPIHQLSAILTQQQQQQKQLLGLQSVPFQGQMTSSGLIGGARTRPPTPVLKGLASGKPLMPRTESLPMLSQTPSKAGSISSMYHELDMIDSGFDTSSGTTRSGTGSAGAGTPNMFGYIESDFQLGMDFDLNDVDGFMMPSIS